MKKRYIQILIFLSFVLLLFPTRVAAQKAEKDNKITIESVVKDEKGNPIIGAVIYGNEGAVVAKTDASGKFKISISDQTVLLIESDGYEPALFRSGEYKNLTEFSLKASLSLHGESDVVNVAFGKVKRGDLVNSVSVLKSRDILRFNNIQDIGEALSPGYVPGLYSTSNIRGLGYTPSALFIVDGLPRDINNINLSEVEQITVLKDINSAILYGNAAVNGVIQITTKRGQAYKKQLSVTGYYGISTPAVLPKYLPSADYMELNNEARTNDGLAPLYDATAISNYRTGNKYRYPNVDYYSNEYLKSVKHFFRALTELSGGNDKATYYVNLGWLRKGSLLDFGEGKTANENRFNIRANVDVKINDWIKTSLDASAVYNSDKGPVSNYWSEASTRLPNLYAPMIPINLINPDDVLLLSRKTDVDGKYLLGGTSSYLKNAFADGYAGGATTNLTRTFSFNNRIDFDLKQLTKGLAFHTNLSFDLFSIFDQSINNTYSVYTPTWKAGEDSIASLTKYGTDARSGTQNVTGASVERRFGFYGMLDYDRTFGNVHHITGSLLGYGNRYFYINNFQGDKNVNLGLRLAYGYKNKYLVDFSSAYVNSVKLPPGNRGGFSPSLGFAWVISSEEFMSGVSAIDYLKLRASGGVLNSETGIPGFFYYDNPYVRSGTNAWADGSWSNGGTISSYGGNMQLGFEKRKEFNLGIEGVFFNHLLSVDANVFTSQYMDQITRPQTKYPSFYADFIPYENFDNNAYNGAELGLSLNKRFGDLSLTIGANMLYANSKVKKRDEVYADGYQYRAGRPVDALFGLVSDGFFMDQTDIANSPLQAFGAVKPGDIKYVDQNKDGIVDANDEVQIGRSQAPFSYGLNLKISYKNFTLFALGTGRTGGNSYITGNYYWVDGNDKYTEYILNRWTDATKTTATFPRLSSVANPNDFRNSTFWLYRNDYFTLDRIQLTYDMPDGITKMLRMKKLSFYVDSSYLLTVSKYKKITELSVGSEPRYRSFSLGVKTVF